MYMPILIPIYNVKMWQIKMAMHIIREPTFSISLNKILNSIA